MKMKKLLLISITAIFALFSFFLAGKGEAEAYSYTRGYYRRSTGSYVMPYYKSNRDSFKWNNFSSKGNVNPFTGKKGYKSW
ncbi:hypothetical protein KKA27_03480 [Patescibacteria group bacterium]|nr:hypothetical protein [Patescibacteria group bacterium]